MTILAVHNATCVHAYADAWLYSAVELKINSTSIFSLYIAMNIASCLTTPNHLAAACTMKFTTVSVLLLSILVVGVASGQLLDADVDAALEHQRILAELEEVHQLRERMLQQGRAFCVSVVHMPACCAP